MMTFPAATSSRVRIMVMSVSTPPSHVGLIRSQIWSQP